MRMSFGGGGGGTISSRIGMTLFGLVFGSIGLFIAIGLIVTNFTQRWGVLSRCVIPDMHLFCDVRG